MAQRGTDFNAPDAHARPAMHLPADVEIRRLQRCGDSRGDLTEVFRSSWGLGVEPVQWNVVRSHPGTLRGVHVHWRHSDYLLAMAGPLWLALKDIRPLSPTRGLACELSLHGDDELAVVIPPGVAHGFYFAETATTLYGVDAYWDESDELGCAWNDPGLGFSWTPVTGPPELSPRDREAGGLDEMARVWRRRAGAQAAHA